MSRRGTCALVGVVVLVAACSGADSPTADSSTTTTTSPTTTSAPSTTGAPAPTTTIDDTDATLAAVEQAYLDAHAAYLAAARDPSNPDLESRDRTPLHGRESRADPGAARQSRRRGWVARPTDPPSRHDRVRSAPLSPGSRRRRRARCLPDRHRAIRGARRRHQMARMPWSTDELTVTRLIVRYELVDGQWKSRQRCGARGPRRAGAMRTMRLATAAVVLALAAVAVALCGARCAGRAGRHRDTSRSRRLEIESGDDPDLPDA